MEGKQIRRGLIPGILLIGLGLVLLIGEFVELGGWVFMVGLGVVFLALYFALRNYSFLIPGCILVGLGIPIAFGEANLVQGEEAGGWIVVGLGLGFCAIWVIDTLFRRVSSWWPLVPGIILTLVGAGIVLNERGLLSPQMLSLLERWWPLILVAIGLVILLQQLVRRRLSA